MLVLNSRRHVSGRRSPTLVVRTRAERWPVSGDQCEPGPRAMNRPHRTNPRSPVQFGNRIRLGRHSPGSEGYGGGEAEQLLTRRRALVGCQVLGRSTRALSAQVERTDHRVVVRDATAFSAAQERRRGDATNQTPDRRVGAPHHGFKRLTCEHESSWDAFSRRPDPRSCALPDARAPHRRRQCASWSAIPSHQSVHVRAETQAEASVIQLLLTQLEIVEERPINGFCRVRHTVGALPSRRALSGIAATIRSYRSTKVCSNVVRRLRCV